MSRRRPIASTATRPRRARAAKPARTAPPTTSTIAASAPARRRGRTLALVSLWGILVIATVGASGEWVLHQSFLRVQHVSVVGATHESVDAVLAASGLSAHPAMIDVGAHWLDGRLGAFTWIGKVTLRRHWPDSVVLTVHERTAVAVAFDAHHVLRYVDTAGDDLGRAPLRANLPTLVFLNPRSATWPFSVAGRPAAYVASRLPKAFAAQVALVTVDARGVVSLQMTTPVRFVLGPSTNLRAKFVSVASVIAHTTLRAGDVVDVTVPGALAVTGPPPS